jgi:hypothetical protein
LIRFYSLGKNFFVAGFAFCLFAQGSLQSITIMSQEEEQESRKRASARQLTDRDDVDDDVQDADSVCIALAQE